MTNRQNFSFSYSKSADDEFDPPFQSADRTVSMDDDEPWTKVMYQFCMFLSGVYGYDIADQIMIYNKYSDSTTSLETSVFSHGGYPDPSQFYDEEE